MSETFAGRKLIATGGSSGMGREAASMWPRAVSGGKGFAVRALPALD